MYASQRMSAGKLSTAGTIGCGGVRSVIVLRAQPPLAVVGQDEVRHPGWAPELSCQLPPVIVSGVESKSLLNLLAEGARGRRPCRTATARPGSARP